MNIFSMGNFYLDNENIKVDDLEWLVDIFLQLYTEGKIDAADCWSLIKDL